MIELEKGKYLFVASLDKLDDIGKAYAKIVFGPGCKIPLEITEFSYVLKTSECDEDYILGDFELSDYIVADILENDSELLFCPKFLNLFSSVKEL